MARALPKWLREGQTSRKWIANQKARARAREQHTARTSSNSQLHPTQEHLKKKKERGWGYVSLQDPQACSSFFPPLHSLLRLHFQSATPTQVGKQQLLFFKKTQLRNTRTLLPSLARPQEAGTAEPGEGEQNGKDQSEGPT